MLVERNLGFTQIGSTLDPVASSDLAHAEWLGTTQQLDAEQTRDALSGMSLDWLIVDHYALDAVWEKTLRPLVKQIAVIDDIADRAHDCDVLIDQNLHDGSSDRYKGLVPEQCVLLVGPSYALLRDEFRMLRNNARPRSGHVRNLLVFFGGMDERNFTGRVLYALSRLELPALAVEVVLGAQHPHLEEIRRLCSSHGFNCHVQTNRMAQLMSAADLAIGAGGAAVWERCCLGLPAFVIQTAINQEEQIIAAGRRGLIYAPQLNNMSEADISRHVLALLENPALLQALSLGSSIVVDGCGLSRVANSLMENEIGIRKASAHDSQNIFQWRNMSFVRSVSRNQNVITWEDHQKWLISVLSSKSKHLLIGELRRAPVGVVRFDLEDEVAEVSIYLTPEALGQGLGECLLKYAEEWLVANTLGVLRLKATVLGVNDRSRRLFLRAGYVVDQTLFTKELATNE
jgi:UDP-2,4-diacetamido-2,4,6-trideoxy-beta-L-altropyranose hydrolase